MILLYTLVSVFLFCFARADPNSVSTALNQFAVNFLAETCRQAGENVNLALSPYTVWNVMAIINEGAHQNTGLQLEKTLGIPPVGIVREQFQNLQQSLIKNIMKSSDGISLQVLNAIFTRIEKKLNPSYQRMIRKVYDVDVASLNFNDAKSASQFINDKLSNATRGRINNIVGERDLTDAQMFITSALFFKGLWDLKFNDSLTKVEPFFNERQEKIGNVHMMFNKGLFPLTKVLDDKAFVVELPYQGGKMSMIVILPLSTPLQTIADMLARKTFASVLNAIKTSGLIFGNDPVKVYMPRFKIASDLNLNYVLHEMGIKDVFHSSVADLSGISPDPMFLSRVIHKAEIDVDEKGTVASAVAIGDIENRIPATSIKLNKPFLYFIYDKETESIVFMGKYSLPKQ